MDLCRDEKERCVRGFCAGVFGGDSQSRVCGTCQEPSSAWSDWLVPSVQTVRGEFRFVLRRLEIDRRYGTVRRCQLEPYGGDGDSGGGSR